jgi:hypothetical protein
MCNAEVPLIVATVYLAFVNLEISSSNLSTNSPTDDTNEESIHSFRYFFSFPINRGSCKGIKSLV